VGHIIVGMPYLLGGNMIDKRKYLRIKQRNDFLFLFICVYGVIFMWMFCF